MEFDKYGWGGGKRRIFSYERRMFAQFHRAFKVCRLHVLVRTSPKCIKLQCYVTCRQHTHVLTNAQFEREKKIAIDKK